MPLEEGVPRQLLAAAIKPLIPKAWRLVDGLGKGRGDNVEKTTVKLKHLAIERAAAAPTRVHDNRIVVTITAPTAADAEVEDQLDDDVVALLHALDAASITWTQAEKVADANRLAWDVTVLLPSFPTPPTPAQ